MPIQTEYNFTHDKLLKGMPALSNQGDRSATCYSDEVIPIGIGLVYGGETDENDRMKVNIPNGAGGLFVGVSAYQHAENTNSTAGLGDLVTNEVIEYRVGDAIVVFRRKVVRVEVVDAVDPTADVYLYHTGANVGNFGGAANGDAEQITGCRWRSVTTGAGLASLEIDVAI